jgi:hypothetical protein
MAACIAVSENLRLSPIGAMAAPSRCCPRLRPFISSRSHRRPRTLLLKEKVPPDVCHMLALDFTSIGAMIAVSG